MFELDDEARMLRRLFRVSTWKKVCLISGDMLSPAFRLGVSNPAVDDSTSDLLSSFASDTVSTPLLCILMMIIC